MKTKGITDRVSICTQSMNKVLQVSREYFTDVTRYKILLFKEY